MSDIFAYSLLFLGFVLLVFVRISYTQEVQLPNPNQNKIKNLSLLRLLAYVIFIVSFLLTLR